MTDAPTILLAGCGKMGSAMLTGWLTAFPDARVTVIEPYDILQDSRVTHLKAASELPDNFQADIVVLAVKPQIMDEACATLRGKIAEGIPVLSIAAGKTLSYFSSVFGTERPVIRSMPNTPAAIGHGITVACPNANVSDTQKILAGKLLSAVGKVEWTHDETLMNAVTAVSGSGPAYVFLLIEELAKAGVAAGLPEEMATTLARQTVIGSARLAEESADIAAATLRQNVTSPGGTTEAALKVLMSEKGLGELMKSAVEAATRRGRELAG